jgi:membrane-associated phospholipid phosphatase
MRLLGAALLLVAVFATPAVAQEKSADADQATSPITEISSPGPFQKLFTTLVRDIKRLPSKENARLALNGTTFALAAYPFDEVTTLGASSSHVLKAGFSGWGKALGREWVQGGVALATYFGGKVLDRPSLAAAGDDLIEAQLLSVTLTQSLKFAVGRTRPDGEARSFPSGHASAAFATAAVLHEHFGRRVAIPAYAIAVYTSASRLQANSHYPTDVIIGSTLGLIVGRTATIDMAGARFQVSPAPVAGGAMVVVAKR